MSEKPEHVSGSFYQNPDLYDLIFGFRVISHQLDFVLSVGGEAYGKPITALLDVACGTGEHVLDAARRGLTAVGADHSPEMIAHAVAKARTSGSDAEFALSDMRALPFSPTFDCAISMFQSLPLLTTNEDLLTHFAGVAQALAPGGVYIIEMGNPRDWLADPPNGVREVWDRCCWSEQRAGARIRAQSYRDPLNLLTETLRVEMQIEVAAPGFSVRLTQTEDHRLLLPETLALLAETGGGFQVHSIHGDFSGRQVFDGGNRCSRMIFVLRRAPERKPRARRTGKAVQQELPGVGR